MDIQVSAQSTQAEPTLRRNLAQLKRVLQKNLKTFVYLGAVLLVIVAAPFRSSAQQANAKGQPPQTVDTPSGKLDFELAVPTKETVTKLYDEMDYQRACQLYLWSFPIVAFANLDVNLEGTTGALPGDLTIYLGNEQSLFFTPNATTPYIVSYLDLAKSGPVVMEIPAGAIAGSAMDFWQRPFV